MKVVVQAGEMMEEGVPNLVIAIINETANKYWLVLLEPPTSRLPGRVPEVQSSDLRLSSHLGFAESFIILCHVK